ncbi:hypothetical protein [Paenibacillus sp. y28]|uniref:hypothetical protein n=1 Tax=Paenibacillus sp. y28 TaxID=3129110 RepID=UPI003015B28A
MFAISLVLSLIVTFLGGGKLLVYLLLLVTGLILGAKYTQLKQLYQDYKLGLKINAIQYSQKESQQLKQKVADLERDLATANQRITLYNSVVQQQQPKGMPFTGSESPSGRFVQQRPDMYDGD